MKVDVLKLQKCTHDYDGSGEIHPPQSDNRRWSSDYVDASYLKCNRR